jgi:predicted nucleotidyltransferase
VKIISTQFDDINHLLEESVSGLKNILSDNLIGIYLYGSLVWGDFDHAASDIDILVALKDDITNENFKELDKFHALLVKHSPFWNDRIEVAYISLNVLKNFKSQVGKVAVISPGEPFNIKKPGKDWLVNYYLLQNSSIILYGPDPKLIIAPISKAEFICYVKDQALEWKNWIVHTKNSVGYQYYAVLTICRALYVVHNGEQVSKLKAGEWMIKKFPKWKDLINRAITRNQVNIVEEYEAHSIYKEVHAFVNDIIDLIIKI